MLYLSLDKTHLMRLTNATVILILKIEQKKPFLLKGRTQYVKPSQDFMIVKYQHPHLDNV